MLGIGALPSPLLPIFIDTQKGLSPKTTTHRLTVEVVPSLWPLQIGGFHEVISFRGFPDSCHMDSSLLSLLISETIEKATTDSILFYYCSLPNDRFVNKNRLFLGEVEEQVKVYCYFYFDLNPSSRNFHFCCCVHFFTPPNGPSDPRHYHSNQGSRWPSSGSWRLPQQHDEAVPRGIG